MSGSPTWLLNTWSYSGFHRQSKYHCSADNCSSKAKQGYLTSALAALYSFLPTKSFATEDQIKRWREVASQAVQDAPPGLKKRLDIQLKWLSDPSSPEGEYVCSECYYRDILRLIVLQDHPIPRFLPRVWPFTYSRVAILVYGLLRQPPSLARFRSHRLSRPEGTPSHRPQYVLE